MKGPGYKLSHDTRRTWRCPACGYERKLVGDVTSLVCNCREGGTFMKIVAERTVAPRPVQNPSEHDVRSSEFGIDDMPVLQPHPSSLPPERTGPRRPRPGSDHSAKPATETAGTETPPESASPSPAAPPPATAAAPPPAVSDIPPAAAEESGDDWGAGIL